MMEVESWLKEEQDVEYISKETTQLGQNMMKLNLGGTSEGRTNVVNVETLFRALSIDERRAKRWEKEEHDWLEDLDITMKEEESHEFMKSRRFVGGEECNEHLAIEDMMSRLSVDPLSTQGLAECGLLGRPGPELGCDICQLWWRSGIQEIDWPRVVLTGDLVSIISTELHSHNMGCKRRIICSQEQALTSLVRLRDRILELALKTDDNCPKYSFLPPILTVLFKGAEKEPGQRVVKPGYQVPAAVAELRNETVSERRNEPVSEPRNEADSEPAAPTLPGEEGQQVQGAGVDVEPGQGAVEPGQGAVDSVGNDLLPGATRTAKLPDGNIINDIVFIGTCSGPPESEGGEGGKQRKQDQEQDQEQDQAQDCVQDHVQDEVKDEVKDQMEDQLEDKLQASKQGRIVLVAGRGSSRKKRKEGEMKLRRIEDLIARMGGGKRKKFQGGQGDVKRLKNVCQGV